MALTCRSRTKRYTRVALGVGAVVGILLAAAGALVPTASDFSGDVLARVNGKAITAQEVAFALGRLAGDSRSSVPRQARLEVLQRLIDQELLIQRGVEIGLLDANLTVRKAIVGAMIDTIVAEVLAKQPTEENLRAFYASHTAVFTVPARAHVQHIYCGGGGDLHRAQVQAEQASAAIARGVSFQEARERYGDEESIPVPDAPLPLHVLRGSLGPTLTSAALAMQVGEISRPLPSPVGYYILRLVALQPEEIRPYEEVKQEVKAEYVRRKRDEKLGQYLTDLRQGATIVLSPKAPRLSAGGSEEPSSGS